MGPRAKAEEAPKGAGKEKRKDSERRRACFRSFNHLSKSEILKRRSQDELLFRCRTCFSSRSESCYDECATFVECLNQMGLGQLHFFCSCLLFFALYGWNMSRQPEALGRLLLHILAGFARVGLDPGVCHAATRRQVAVNLVTMVLSWTACFGNMIVE